VTWGMVGIVVGVVAGAIAVAEAPADDVVAAAVGYGHAATQVVVAVVAANEA